MEEEREEAEINLNGVIYAVTMMTDVEIIVRNLLQQTSAASSLFLCWSGTIMCEVTGCRRASADLPKGGLRVPYTMQHSWESLKIGMK